MSNQLFASRDTVLAQRDVHSWTFCGVDVFVEWHGSVETLANKMQAAARIGPFELALISNRGRKMWPGLPMKADTATRWRCRFINTAHEMHAERAVPELLSIIGEKMRWMHVEKLETHGEASEYARARGERSSQN